MADLKQNITYDNASKAMSAMTGKLANIKRSVSQPSKKSINTSKYSGLINNVKSKLGTTTTPYGGSTKYEKFHPGIDIANKIGTPISAYAGGKVISEREGTLQGSPDFGNYIIIQDKQGNKFRYSHLGQNWVDIGDIVKPGQRIAEMSNTGQTYSQHGGTGSHLDLRIKDIYGKYINPSKFIN